MPQKYTDKAIARAALKVLQGEPKDLAHKKLAAYLMKQYKTKDIPTITRLVKDLHFASGYIEADVTTASPLTDQNKQEVRQLLESSYPQAKQIAINEQVDKSLIGGITIKTTDRFLDRSIRHTLNKFVAASSKKDGVTI